MAARGINLFKIADRSISGGDMSGITNWSEALAHPCFWDGHYAPLLYRYGTGTDTLETVFGCSREQGKEFSLLLYGYENEEDEGPFPSDAEVDYEALCAPANVLTFAFPEDYTWALEFVDGEVSHHIYHPQEPLWGLVVAKDGGGEDSCVPGLRWAEVKHIVACLQATWPGPFNLQVLIPSLILSQQMSTTRFARRWAPSGRTFR